jgi:hypothetical protein
MWKHIAEGGEIMACGKKAGGSKTEKPAKAEKKKEEKKETKKAKK